MIEVPRCRSCGAVATLVHDRLTGVVATACDTCGDTQGRGAVVPLATHGRGPDHRVRATWATRLAERNAAIVTGYTEDGKSTAALAAEHDVHLTTIHRILVRHGIYTDRLMADRP